MWDWISGDPFRLLCSCALFHAMLLTSIAWQGDFQAGNMHWILCVLIYGITSLPLLGYLMSELPKWFRQSPVHYLRYFSCFVSGFTALSLMQYGLFSGSLAWLLWGDFLLLLSHAIALRGIWSIYKWVDLSRHSRMPRLMGCLLLGMAGNPLFIIGAWRDDPLWMAAALVAGGLCLWLTSATSTRLLRINARREPSVVLPP